MRNRVIFIGPLYPPKDVIDYLSALTVYITKSGTTGSIADEYTGLSYPAIKDLNITNGVITFTLIASIHGANVKPIAIPSTSEDVIIQTNPTVTPADFNGGSTLYNISPCCITITGYHTVPKPADVKVQCEAPVQCTLAGNKLSISLTPPSTLTDADYIIDNKQQSGIKAINGVGGGGDITISGVGAVTVAVSPGVPKEQ